MVNTPVNRYLQMSRGEEGDENRKEGNRYLYGHIYIHPSTCINKNHPHFPLILSFRGAGAVRKGSNNPPTNTIPRGPILGPNPTALLRRLWGFRGRGDGGGGGRRYISCSACAGRM